MERVRDGRASARFYRMHFVRRILRFILCGLVPASLHVLQRTSLWLSNCGSNLLPNWHYSWLGNLARILALTLKATETNRSLTRIAAESPKPTSSADRERKVGLRSVNHSGRITGKPDIAVQLLTVWLPDIRHHAAPGDVVGGLAS
jgi:hypothetical protein